MNGLRKIRFRFEKIVEGFNKRYKNPCIRILRVKRSNSDNHIIFIDLIAMGKSGTNSDLTLTLRPNCAKYFLSHLVKELEKFKEKGENDETIRRL